jgi:hypothetical protein
MDIVGNSWADVGVSARPIVQCEILPVLCVGGRVLYVRRLEVATPAWWVECPPARHPSEVVMRALGLELGGEGELPDSIVHSTSWRYDTPRRALVLSYLVVLRRLLRLPAGFVLESVEAVSWDPQTGTGTHGERVIRASDVLIHGLRHFALLRLTDPMIARALPDDWHATLGQWQPLPAGLLDHYLGDGERGGEKVPVARVDYPRLDGVGQSSCDGLP